MSTWPSSSKLEKLRASGKAPYSSFCSACAIAVAVLISTWWLKDEWLDFLEAWNDLARGAQLSVKFLNLSVKRDLLMLFGIPALAALTISLLAGLAQTKFLFRPANILPHWSRLINFRSLGPRSILLRIIQAFGLGSLILVSSAALFWLCMPSILGVFNKPINTALLWLQQAGLKAWPFLLAALAALMLIAWGIAWLRFMWANRMTAEELKQEGS